MRWIGRSLIVGLLLILLAPGAVVADELMDYRIAVEDNWYLVQDDYEYIDLHYVLFTLDAVFTDNESEREQWSNQLDEQAVGELWDFFNKDSVQELEYTDEVINYLQSNFEIDEGGGLLTSIANFFKSILNFFSGLF
ncbi:hypothetical protein [Alkalibacillus aidingensis]|uniref:hypothetical protein n=1 Tax=Alkalibacillus aidingensis TaxID=2747607 RepID=UPI00166128A0|nr:hypothetical protein [Alkalibacillus aidingensis]